MDQERDLIDRYIAGDDQAAWELYSAFEKVVRLAIRAMEVPPADVEDIAQEVWRDACRQLRAGNFRGECLFASWLKKIVLGKVGDYRRDQGARIIAAAVALETIGVPPDLVEFARAETLVLAQEALATLAPRHRVAFDLRYRLGWEMPDIAKALGLSSKRAYAVVAESRNLFSAVIIGQERSSGPKRLRNKADE